MGARGSQLTLWESSNQIMVFEVSRNALTVRHVSKVWLSTVGVQQACNMS